MSSGDVVVISGVSHEGETRSYGALPSTYPGYAAQGNNEGGDHTHERSWATEAGELTTKDLCRRPRRRA